jgi:hypothetical protein
MATWTLSHGDLAQATGTAPTWTARVSGCGAMPQRRLQ